MFRSSRVWERYWEFTSFKSFWDFSRVFERLKIFMTLRVFKSFTVIRFLRGFLMVCNTHIFKNIRIFHIFLYLSKHSQLSHFHIFTFFSFSVTRARDLWLSASFLIVFPRCLVEGSWWIWSTLCWSHSFFASGTRLHLLHLTRIKRLVGHGKRWV